MSTSKNKGDAGYRLLLIDQNLAIDSLGRWSDRAIEVSVDR
jgi:hypothetical protein